jgi:hypothetical protein
VAFLAVELVDGHDNSSRTKACVAHFTEKPFSVNPLQKRLDYGLSFFPILIYFAEL